MFMPVSRLSFTATPNDGVIFIACEEFLLPADSDSVPEKPRLPPIKKVFLLI